MELQHFSHIHPLVFHEEPSNAICSGCGELVSSSSFSCMACGFHLHKKCAEAPSELALPFHPNHNLILLTSKPYWYNVCICIFCLKTCPNFVYHCSCRLNLHIKCALFLYQIAEKKIGELQFSHVDPLISSETHSETLKKAICFACWNPLLRSAYLSLDTGFGLHKKCVELPLEINHLCHPQHSLFLQFITERLPCHICQETQPKGLVYCCSSCKFVLHSECVPVPSPIIEDRKHHEHPFSRLFRRVSFICDACGTSGNYVSYICSTCSLLVHKKCISLPRIIKSLWHQHPISHKYFLEDNECGTLECGICHEEVNKVYGSYCCSACKFIAHVNCATEDVRHYDEINESSKDAYNEKVNEYQLLTVNNTSFSVIEEISLGGNKVGTVIKHFSHEHNLVSSDEVTDERSYCDGCSLLIASSLYRCLQCDFFLHKSCVELPKKRQTWIHTHQQPLDLVHIFLFKCNFCPFDCSGFAYICQICFDRYCVRCANSPLSWTSQAHEHPLHSDFHYTGQCNASGGSLVDRWAFRCKGCNFNVDARCALLPKAVAHKCDKHPLKLAYHEDNDYSEYHYCDICEERRSPSRWFYNCTICNTSAHLRCVLGDYPFIKRGTRIFIQGDHPHGLVFVQKDVYDLPEACCRCRQLCFDLALECSETNCNYIVHWRCSAFGRYSTPFFGALV